MTHTLPQVDFSEVKKQVVEIFNVMENFKLYTVDVDGDELWEAYLNGIPEEVRPEFICNNCKRFIKNYGNIVAINNGKLMTLWDFSVGYPFTNSIARLYSLVSNASIKNEFVSDEKHLGVDKNKAVDKSNGETIYWNHFHLLLPANSVNTTGNSEASILGANESKFGVFKRGFETLTIEATETVLEQIERNSIYNCQQYKDAVEDFLRLQQVYANLSTEREKEFFLWLNFKKYPAIRNDIAIGVILIDLSEGMDLEDAIKKFERSVMCPTNYQRPNAIITRRQKEEAVKWIQDNGYELSLNRKHLTVDEKIQKNTTKSFIKRSKSVEDELNALKFDIVLYIINSLLDEEEKRNVEQAVNVEREESLELLKMLTQQDKLDALKALTPEERIAKIKALETGS